MRAIVTALVIGVLILGIPGWGVTLVTDKEKVHPEVKNTTKPNLEHEMPSYPSEDPTKSPLNPGHGTR